MDTPKLTGTDQGQAGARLIEQYDLVDADLSAFVATLNRRFLTLAAA